MHLIQNVDGWPCVCKWDQQGSSSAREPLGDFFAVWCALSCTEEESCWSLRIQGHQVSIAETSGVTAAKVRALSSVGPRQQLDLVGVIKRDPVLGAVGRCFTCEPLLTVLYLFLFDYTQ